jgi:hypothetical protein
LDGGEKLPRVRQAILLEALRDLGRREALWDHDPVGSDLTLGDALEDLAGGEMR